MTISYAPGILVRIYFRCNIIGEEISTPVCVMVKDQEVDEHCEDKIPEVECFDQVCTQSTKTVFEKKCLPQVERSCQTVVDEHYTKKCQTVMTTKIHEECRDEMEKTCVTEFDYVCEEENNNRFSAADEVSGTDEEPREDVAVSPSTTTLELLPKSKQNSASLSLMGNKKIPTQNSAEVSFAKKLTESNFEASFQRNPKKPSKVVKKRKKFQNAFTPIRRKRVRYGSKVSKRSANDSYSSMDSLVERVRLVWAENSSNFNIYIYLYI